MGQHFSTSHLRHLPPQIHLRKLCVKPDNSLEHLLRFPNALRIVSSLTHFAISAIQPQPTLQLVQPFLHLIKPTTTTKPTITKPTAYATEQTPIPQIFNNLTHLIMVSNTNSGVIDISWFVGKKTHLFIGSHKNYNNNQPTKPNFLQQQNLFVGYQLCGKNWARSCWDEMNRQIKNGEFFTIYKL